MILHKIPGFRTNKKWKKIISSLVYIIFIMFFMLGLIGGIDSCITSKDKVVYVVETIAMVFCILGVPYIILTDFLGLSKRLKHFKNKPILFRVVFLPVFWIISFFVLGGIVLPATEKAYSDGYIQNLTQERVKREEDEALAKSKQEEEKALAKATEEKEALAKAEKEELTNVEASLDLKKFKKELKNLLKNNEIEKCVELINTTKYEESSDIVEDQLGEFIKKMLKNKSKAILKENNIEEVQKIIDQLAPIHKLTNGDKYECVNILNQLEELVACTKAIDRLEEEIGDFNVAIPPIDINKIEVLDVYVHYKIKDSSTLVNVLQDVADRINSSKSEDYYYFTGYDNWLGTIIANDNFEGVIMPKETKFTKSGNYTMQAIQQGTMTLISSDGFEREVPKYREVSSDEITRYYDYDNMKEKADRIVSYEGKITAASEAIEKFMK